MRLHLSARSRGVIAINVAAVIFGTAALYGKLHIAPFWIVAMRAGFAALTLALVCGLRNDLRTFSASTWRRLAVSGLFLTMHWLSFFVSVQHAGVAVATLTFATFPLFTVIVEAARKRRLPRLAELAAATAIIVAVALLVDPSGGRNNIGGAAAGLVSALTYALFWRVSQKLSALPPIMLSLSQNAVVVALLAPTLAFATPAPSSALEWLSLAALGVVNTAVMLLLYLYALKRISASTCSGFVALEPVYAIVFAALLFAEPVTPWIFASIILILGASLTLMRFDKQPTPAL